MVAPCLSSPITFHQSPVTICVPKERAGKCRLSTDVPAFDRIRGKRARLEDADRPEPLIETHGGVMHEPQRFGNREARLCAAFPIHAMFPG